MARTSGKAGEIWIQTSSGEYAAIPDSELVLGITSWELDMKGGAEDITGMDSGGVKEFLATLTEWSGTCEVFSESTATNEFDEFVIGDTVDLNLLFTSTDSTCYYGTAIVTDVKPTVQFDGAIKWSVSFQGTGALTYGTIPT